MDKKLTDNEIVKALTYCVNYKDGHCENCPYREDEKGIYCVRYLAQNSLDLINRLQAENERLLQKLQQAQEEIERLKGVLPEKSGVFTVVENAVVFTKTTEEYDLFLEKIFTEAYKDCVEKAKEKAKGLIGEPFINDFMNDLLKELVGEDK